MVKKNKINIGHKKPLVTAPLFVEGISRSGKFLLADILHGFSGVEPVQNHLDLEHIPIFARFNLIDQKTAKEFFQCMVDVYTYDSLIGRNLNYRQSDKSSVFNIPHYREFTSRSKDAHSDRLVNKFYREKLYPFFIIHELMPNITICFKTFPHLKVISLSRQPIDLVYSWHVKGYGQRILTDPKIFVLPLAGRQSIIPWYALDWQSDYFSLKPMDRIIKSIDVLLALYKKSYNKLPPKDKRKILFVSYEAILSQPAKVINLLEKFLGSKVRRRSMAKIIVKQKLPNPAKLNLHHKKLALIRRHASDKYYQRLLKLNSQYLKHPAL